MLVLLITLCAIVYSSSTVSAQSTADSSALLEIDHAGTNSADQVNYAAKKAAIKGVLERYDSPMLGSVDDFMKACRTYNLNCYLLPAIAGLESTFGQFTWPGSNNPFGWDRGYMAFKDWGEAIDTVGQGLRENYMNERGALDVYSIGPIYSESPTWAARVHNLMLQFEQEERNNALFFSKSVVEL